MNLSSAYSASVSFVSSSWAASIHHAVPLLMRNMGGKPPTASPWVEVDIIWGPGRLQTLDGSGRVNGSFSCNIFTLKNTGVASSSLLADTLRQIIASASIQGMRFDTPSGPTPVPTNGDWFIRNITCPFNMNVDIH